MTPTEYIATKQYLQDHRHGFRARESRARLRRFERELEREGVTVEQWARPGARTGRSVWFVSQTNGRRTGNVLHADRGCAGTSPTSRTVTSGTPPRRRSRRCATAPPAAKETDGASPIKPGQQTEDRQQRERSERCGVNVWLRRTVAAGDLIVHFAPDRVQRQPGPRMSRQEARRRMRAARYGRPLPERGKSFVVALCGSRLESPSETAQPVDCAECRRELEHRGQVGDQAARADR